MKSEPTKYYTQRSHGVKITSLLRQNDVVTSFWRNNNVSQMKWSLSCDMGSFLQNTTKCDRQLARVEGDYGVSFMSSKCNLGFTAVMSCCKQYRVISHCNWTVLTCLFGTPKHQLCAPWCLRLVPLELLRCCPSHRDAAGRAFVLHTIV